MHHSGDVTDLDMECQSEHEDGTECDFHDSVEVVFLNPSEVRWTCPECGNETDDSVEWIYEDPNDRGHDY